MDSEKFAQIEEENIRLLKEIETVREVFLSIFKIYLLCLYKEFAVLFLGVFPLFVKATQA